VSWVALEDLIGTVVRAVDDDAMSGLYHLTSPDPVRNTQMMAAVRRATGRRFGLPAPAPVTRVGAWLLGSDPALALTGRRGIPARLLAEGATFAVPRFEDAVRVALDGRGRPPVPAGRDDPASR
jgi:NAD dependent epimerase/dehydratase family enzyme